MRFASSRLLTAGVLTAAFALHPACGGSVDLDFVGADGSGGIGSGKGGTNSGKGGTNSGKGGKGGTGSAGEGSDDGGSSNGGSADGGSGNVVGTGGDGGSGNVVGTGGDGGSGNVVGTGGEAGSGVVGTGGDGGSGNVVGTGGEAGSGSNCVPTTEICDDGVDNDCDDLRDCPILLSAFPENGKAAAGHHVQLNFEVPAEGAFQCRVGKPTEINSALWANCAGPDVFPIGDADSLDPNRNGLKLIQVRLAYTVGFSEVVEWTAYTHHSLHNELLCASQATDAQYFAFASTLLSPAGAFGALAKLDNPFISVTFDPPVDTYINVSDADGLVEPLSLRKRFVTDPTGEYLLMSRVYESKAYQGACQALAVFIHDNNGVGPLNTKYKPLCAALVFNKKGAGVCLQAAGGVVTLPTPNNTTYFVEPLYDGDVDNLLWRELKRINNGTGRTRYFSPKCSGDPSCVAASIDPQFTLYLPDVELFD